MKKEFTGALGALTIEGIQMKYVRILQVFNILGTGAGIFFNVTGVTSNFLRRKLWQGKKNA